MGETSGGQIMILADKIILLRKKAGWSQEELAEQLSVSRQSVSKWEGAQSIPDMEKIVQMSRLFGVSTDYLLKDEIEESTPTTDAAPEKLRRVTMEDAADYLAKRRADAPKIALATMLCVFSPILLLFLGGFAPSLGISEGAATGIGIGALLLFVAIAVAIFLACGFRVKNYEFLEKEAFETEYGVSGMVRERLNAFAATYARLNIVGVVLCILAAVPVILAACMGAEDQVAALTVCLLLFFVGCGCFAFVRGGVYHGAMEQLLEEGDYTREQKKNSGLIGAISGCYWLIVTAVYLFVTFGPVGMTPDRSWFIWAVGGVLFGAIMAIVGVLTKKNR